MPLDADDIARLYGSHARPLVAYFAGMWGAGFTLVPTSKAHAIARMKDGREVTRSLYVE